MRHSKALSLVALTLALAACQPDPGGADPHLATLGSPPPGSPASPFGHGYADKLSDNNPGILLAGWAGSSIGKTMDDESMAKNRQAERRVFTAPVGQQVTWKNPANDDSGTVVAASDSYAVDGAYCRMFQQSVTLGGVPQSGSVKACQQPDGSWKVAK